MCIRDRLIPNRLNAAVAVLAVLNLLLSPARWAGALIGMVCISVPMLDVYKRQGYSLPRRR